MGSVTLGYKTTIFGLKGVRKGGGGRGPKFPKKGLRNLWMTPYQPHDPDCPSLLKTRAERKQGHSG